MRQQVIIPWREMDCIYRKKHFNFLCEYYSQDFDIVLGDREGDFNRSAARNQGVVNSESEVAVVIDADNYIPLKQIHQAISDAKKRDYLFKPFDYFGYLTEDSTNAFYDFYGIMDLRPEFINKPERDFTGGAYVMKRSLWLDLGGMDEGFVGWGAEDDAWHLHCKKNGVRVRYVPGYDYHLYHPAHRVTSEYNYEKLMREYVNGD
jgi:GT2 family glycosyltransferase